MPRARVLVYNVHGFRAGVARVAAAVAHENPDIALLNEVGWARLRLRRFARRMGMDAVSGVRPFTGISNAVLARRPWRIVRKEVVQFTRQWGRTRRGAVLAVVGRAGLRVKVACVHLGLSDPERLRNVRELTDLVLGPPGPLMVGGDLNEGPDGKAASWMAERLWDVFAVAPDEESPTFPADAPRARIDYLFVSEGVTVEQAWVASGDAERAASDHLPVFADVVVGE